ncbi:hypothetical protein R9X47_28715 [Wukongibacter baidiensis]|uniref:hypothetical protein n=1 Tax=Wukongibacter baidiensis TaxID=1723361 RepID=UPI003D7FAB5B
MMEVLNTYNIATGVWGCDLISSKSLDDSQKSRYVNFLKNKVDAIVAKTSAKILGYQFRGDGYLVAFDAKNARSSLIQFATFFCKEINKAVQCHEIKDNFRIRTYMDFFELTVSEMKDNEITLTGKSIDTFCSLIDNKSNERYVLKKQYSTVLITTQSFHNSSTILQDEDFKKTTIAGKEYFKKEFEIQNISFKIYSSDDHLIIPSDVVTTLSSKYRINLIHNEQLDKYIIKYTENIPDIYDFFNDLSSKSYIYGEKHNCKYLLTSINLEYADQEIDDYNLKDIFERHIGLDLEFKNYLVWSDVCLDKFRNLKKFKSEEKYYRKLPLSDKLRAYYLDCRNNNSNKKILKYSQIKDTSIYLHSFDYSVQKSLEDFSLNINIAKHISQQLEVALLLSDHVIVHAAEILRNNLVYDVLYKYKNLISDGSINLLFSSKVNDIERDFYNYIEEKIAEYDYSNYGKDDAMSLKKALKSKHYHKAIKLISSSPNVLKRDIDGTNTLEELINKDLHNAIESVYIREDKINEPSILLKNYTIKQLLSIKIIVNDEIYDIIPREIQFEIIDLIDKHVNGVISAGIVKNIFFDKIDQFLQEKYYRWYQALVNRANFLYGQVNTGRNLYMEYLPIRLKNSFFDLSVLYKFFSEYLRVDGLLGSNQIISIRKKTRMWNKFKMQYSYLRILEKEMYLSGFDKYRVTQKLNTNIKKTIKSLMDI